MLRRLPALLLCLLTLSFTACDSDSDGDGGGNGGGGGGSTIGSASVTVSGAFTSSFSGNAAFGVNEDGSSFSLVLFEGNVTAGVPTGEFAGLGRSGDRPTEGVYQIGGSASAMVFSGAYGSDASAPTSGTFVVPSSGTLTITSSSGERVAGSFTFTGQAFTGTGGMLGTATVEGTFSAELAQNISVPTSP